MTFEPNRSKIMNVIDSKSSDQDRQISPRNPRKLECAAKPVSIFPRPALERLSTGWSHPVDKKSLQIQKLEHILVARIAWIRAEYALAGSCLLAIMLICPCVASSLAQSIQTSVPHAILIDAETRSVLFEKDADASVIPASTVKVMTAEVVFRELSLGHIRLEDQFPISEYAWRFGGAPSRGSTMFASVDSRVRVEDLIKGLVIVSGNDAAIALAEGISGSEGAFATTMTVRARELGLNGSTFTNSWGRGDPEQTVTPRDMVHLAEHVIRSYPEFYKYFAEKEFSWNKIKQTNRNPLLSMGIGADGLKTGNIDASGFQLVGSAVENGQRLILALYGARNAKERAAEALKLLLWGFRSFESRIVFKAGEAIGKARIYGGSASDVPLVAVSDVRVLVPRTATERLSGRVVYRGPLVAPVEQGEKAGRLEISLGPKVILDVPLVTGGSAGSGTLARHALDAGFEYAHDLLGKFGAMLQKYITRP
jgi:D-alanyl-D-alanine carboxypeptidase (penicillin-binding protein 5/6)